MISAIDVLVEGITWNEDDGHYNIWVEAINGCTNDEIFNEFGFDDAPNQKIITFDGEILD